MSKQSSPRSTDKKGTSHPVQIDLPPPSAKVKTKNKPTTPPARDANGRLLPGHTANPNGRPPRDHSLTDTLKAILDETPDIKKALMTSVIKNAIDKGDMGAIKLLWSYLDGQPTQRQELTGKDGEAIRLQTLAELVIGATLPHDTNPNPDEPGASDLESAA